jgi:hypothetical protein
MYEAEIAQLRQYVQIMKEIANVFCVAAPEIVECDLPLIDIGEMMQRSVKRQDEMLAGITEGLDETDNMTAAAFFHDMFSALTPLRGYSDLLLSAYGDGCEFPETVVGSMDKLHTVALACVALLTDMRQAVLKL